MDNRQPTPSHTSLGIDNPMLSNILDRMLTLWTLSGIAALLFSLSRMAETGWLLLYDIQIAVVSLIIAVSLARRFISNRHKSLLMLAISLMIAVSGTYFLGMLAGGIFFLPLAGVLLGLYYSPRITSLFALGVLLYLVALAIGYHQGYLTTTISAETLMTSANHWAVYILCLAMFFLVTLTTIFGYRQVAEDLLAEVNRQRDEISQMINHDPLTGLPNYRLAMDRLDMACQQARRDDAHCAAMFIDLDNFKRLNDSYSHEAGDYCLQAVANRLAGELRAVDTVARIGGDEFLVVLGNIQHGEHAVALANKLLNAVTPVIEFEGAGIHLSLSIGVALYPQHGLDGRSLKRRADEAMYRVKLEGKNGVSIIDSGQSDVA